jgi:hypothetical protein
MVYKYPDSLDWNWLPPVFHQKNGYARVNKGWWGYSCAFRGDSEGTHATVGLDLLDRTSQALSLRISALLMQKKAIIQTWVDDRQLQEYWIYIFLTIACRSFTFLLITCLSPDVQPRTTTSRFGFLPLRSTLVPPSPQGSHILTLAIDTCQFKYKRLVQNRTSICGDEVSRSQLSW